MMPNDNPYPRKLSTPLQQLDTSKPSNISSPMNSNQMYETYTEKSTLPLEQVRSDNNIPEEEKMHGTQGSFNKKIGTLHSEVLSPIEFISLRGSTTRNQETVPPETKKQESDHSDSEGHRVYGRYMEEYKKKYPSDVQHLKNSNNGSSPPENKKFERMSFRRICNNNSLGETLVSEFIQDPLPDKESNSKSSKLSSNDNLVDLYQAENKRLPQTQVIRPEKVVPPQNKLRLGPQEIDPSIDISSEDLLRLSDLEALHRKRALKMQEPVNFNVMVMGESGLGKSTFIDCFLETKYDVKDIIRPPTKDFTEKEGQRSYKGMTFKIKLIDAPGYTHSENIEAWYKRMKDYIIQQFIAYKEEKRRKQREKKASFKPIEDKRIHVMLYFLGGPRIRSRDLQLMKKFRKYCNIIPVLARGDAYIVDEIREMKEKLIEKAHNLKIDWFDFAEALKESPEKLKELTECKFGPCPPFLIISSVSKIKVGPNQYVYGRNYPWGLCNIEDPTHSDFKLLQTLLGGHICTEAIQLTSYYYKEYIKGIKDKKKAEEELERRKNLGLGAVVVVGVVGALMAVKKKFAL